METIVYRGLKSNCLQGDLKVFCPQSSWVVKAIYQIETKVLQSARFIFLVLIGFIY